MSYEKLGFVSGQILTAQHLNHMEDGIANAGGVTSWNDLTDKPFYSEVITGEILPETVVTESMMLLSQPLNLIVGSIYTLIYNGIEHKFTAVEFAPEEGMSFICLGNTSIFGGVDNSDVPFILAVDVIGDSFGYAGATAIMSLDESTGYTVSITGAEVVYKIDEKYLPKIVVPDNLVNGTGEGSLRGVECQFTTGKGAIAMGLYTLASGDYSHAEGNYTEATGIYSHAEGDHTEATALASHSEGFHTQTSGIYSHAEGNYTEATGRYSHVEGSHTIASGSSQHVQGKFNIEDTEEKYAHIVGNGTDYNIRSNAHTLDWDGNAWFAGGIELTSPNGTRYRFTVSDDGTLTSTVVTE